MTHKIINIPKIVEILEEEFAKHQTPVVDLIEIQTHDPFKILISTILSARTKDNVTAKACERLFKKISNFKDINNISVQEIEKLIFPVGFYKTKAQKLKELPKVIEEKFHNRIPEEIENLILLPGVGRKTANLVRAIAFKQPAICVDTHVHRFFNRIGYIESKTPFETEMKLRNKLPKKYWLKINSIIVSYGQNLCKPRNPNCADCRIQNMCYQIGL